jgi:hypothetical protein
MGKERAVQDSSGKNARCTGARAAHDRLLGVGDDKAALHDLTELAVTWGALDYSSAVWTPPPRWLDLAAMHYWQDRAHVERLFALVADIALHSTA